MLEWEGSYLCSTMCSFSQDYVSQRAKPSILASIFILFQLIYKWHISTDSSSTQTVSGSSIFQTCNSFKSITFLLNPNFAALTVSLSKTNFLSSVYLVTVHHHHHCLSFPLGVQVTDKIFQGHPWSWICSILPSMCNPCL